MSGLDLAPGLLLASPSLRDRNFERTVVLLGRHDEEGALGWVLNGPELASVAELLRASDLLPSGMRIPKSGAFARTARVGGPVATNSGWLIYPEDGGTLPGEMRVGEVSITGEVGGVTALLEGQGPGDFRFVMGCAGWAPGQLEAEIGAGAWLPAALTASLVFAVEAESLWDEAYKRTVGVGPAAFSSHRGLA